MYAVKLSEALQNRRALMAPKITKYGHKILRNYEQLETAIYMYIKNQQKDRYFCLFSSSCFLKRSLPFREKN